MDSRWSLPLWIPAPRFRGDKFTPAEAGAGMTKGAGMTNTASSIQTPNTLRLKIRRLKDWKTRD